MKKNKTKRGNGTSAIAPIKNTKFVKIKISKKGSMIVCEATTEDGVTENYIWSRKSHRQEVHTNTIATAKINVDNDVPEGKGWDWDYRY